MTGLKRIGAWLAGVFAALAFIAPANAAALWQTLPWPPALPPAAAQGYVTHDGARIYYATYGAGSPVIMLHGGLANSEVWGNQVPALTAAGHRVILIDSRGHGRSTRDERPFTYELMESDVVAVMDTLKVQKAAVVGWSDGAIVSLVMALKDPDRITRAFAFGANMDPSGNRTDTQGNPNFVRFEVRAAADYARLSATPTGFAAFANAITRMWDTEPNYKAADLATIHVPVAIVDGDHDEAIKREHTEYLARSIPGAKLVIFKDASHFAFLQRPGAINAAVLAFLKGR